MPSSKKRKATDSKASAKATQGMQNTNLSSTEIWDKFWPGLMKRKKAKDTIAITGKYDAKSGRLNGSWSFLNISKKKANPFSYKQTINDRDSQKDLHPACMGQNMRRIFADVYTSQSGFYDVEKISPVFYGVEAAVNRVPTLMAAQAKAKATYRDS